MRRGIAIAGLLLLAGCGHSDRASATRNSGTAQPLPGALPIDVVTFKAKRDTCDHFRGEESDGPSRAAEIDKALAVNCTGTDISLAELRKRYVGDARVTAALAGYEAKVE